MTECTDEAKTTLLCIGKHRVPRSIEHGHLCRGCVDWILDTLGEIVDLAALLPELVVPGPNVNSRGRAVDPAAPARLEILATLDQRTTFDDGDPIVGVIAVLGSWADVVREESHLADRAGKATVFSEASMLAAHVLTIAAHPWADELITELRKSLTWLQRLTNDVRPLNRVGLCPTIWEGNEHECSGNLFQDRSGGMRVTCTRCGRIWDDDELSHLGLLMTS